MTPLLSINHVSFQYPRASQDPTSPGARLKSICHDFNFTAADGDIVCLLGPSGCGKTTVLRLIAGFERPTLGSITLAGKVLADDHIFIEPALRGIGYVFQDFALFPHLTVSDNIAFGLQKQDKSMRRERVAEMLALTGLEAFDQRYPHQLSGGQRQRVALARALAPRPKLLLMDEPFSSLDIELREKLSLEVRAVLKTLKTTALFVTHDQNEAFSIADTVSVMNGGVIEQTDSAYNLYHRPLTRFVADFVGQGVLIDGRGTADGNIQTELGVMRPTNVSAATIVRNSSYKVLLRPDDILHDDASTSSAKVLHKAFRGADILYTLQLDSGTEVLSLVPSHHNHALGQKIGIQLEIDHVVAFQA